MAKATVRNVDFSDVKDGGNFNQSRIPAGDYLALITKVEDAVTKESKKDAYQFSIKIKSKPSSVFRYYCVLQENQLWKLRNLFIAAGKTVPKKRMKVDPNQLVGKLIGVTIEDAEDYKDKEQSEVAGVFPASELGDDEGLSNDNASIDDEDEDEDDEPAGPRFTPSDDDEEEADDEEEEADEDEAEDLSGLDRNELKTRIKAIQPDFQARKSQTDEDLRNLLAEMLNTTAAADEADDEEDDEPAPAPKQSAAAKRKAAKAKVEDDDLDGLDIDDL